MNTSWFSPWLVVTGKRRSTIPTPTIHSEAHTRLSYTDSSCLRKRQETECAPTAPVLPLKASRPVFQIPVADRILAAEEKISDALTKARFAGIVRQLVRQFSEGWTARGHNFGPRGMPQTGVPSGEVCTVRGRIGMPSDVASNKPNAPFET